jgi:hypothetical protein
MRDTLPSFSTGCERLGFSVSSPFVVRPIEQTPVFSLSTVHCASKKERASLQGRRGTMIVSRWMHDVKRGCMEEAVTLHLTQSEKIGHPHPVRVYASATGRSHVLAFEMEFGSLEEFEKFWTDWTARPETSAFVEKLRSLLGPGSTHEFWDLAE